ncbi:hypothetical protein [Oligoflexus tunisiensis]|uniref:hypothetical protein n=1 Tax=Oligoflexus tunisiensis TaxID=708132 RepID=UPI00114C8C8F|nr:hypothetical protein [Oligoflexus tunisiensis]
MDFFKRRALWCALLVTACGPGQETVRGRAHLYVQPAVPQDEEVTTEDTIIMSSDPNQAVVFDGNVIPSLSLAAEVDQSTLPAGWMQDIFAIHKIDANRTLVFGKSKQTWLLDETQGGVLSRLSLDLSPPEGERLYVLENQNFWLVGRNNLGFPSTLSQNPSQLTLVNIVPDLMKDPANPPRVLYAGPQRMILASEKRTNIVLLDGDRARVIALDFPKMRDGTPVPIASAGLMQDEEAFWFLAPEYLLLLRKAGEDRWRWVISSFRVDIAGVLREDPTDLAMLVSAEADGGFAYVGRTFELMAGKIFEQNPLKLSVDINADPALDPYFINTVQPLLKTYCTPCHVGAETFPSVKASAAAFAQSIANGSMPKNMALTREQIKTLTDYLNRVVAMP